MEPMFGRGKFQYDIFLSAGIPLPRFVRGRFSRKGKTIILCGFCHDPHSSLAGSSRICTCLKCLSNCRCTLSCHRPCVASACAGRSLERWSPSKVGLSGALVLVWEPTWPPRTIEQRLLLRLWPVWQPPVRRPSRDSNVCICGPSRNDRAGCAPVVHWSEQSLKRVYRTSCT
jgi:hypothetical protein